VDGRGADAALNVPPFLEEQQPAGGGLDVSSFSTAALAAVSITS